VRDPFGNVLIVFDQGKGTSRPMPRARWPVWHR